MAGRLIDSAGVTVFEGTAVGIGGSQTVFAAQGSVAYNTPGVTTGIAMPGYVPKQGDIIIYAIYSVPVAFNGTTPVVDLYIGSTATAGFTEGIGNGPVDLTSANNNFAPGSGGNEAPSGQQSSFVLNADADAVYIVVSRDGTKGGTAVGGTAGQLTVTLQIIRPA